MTDRQSIITQTCDTCDNVFHTWNEEAVRCPKCGESTVTWNNISWADEMDVSVAVMSVVDEADRLLEKGYGRMP